MGAGLREEGTACGRGGALCSRGIIREGLESGWRIVTAGWGEGRERKKQVRPTCKDF